MNYRLLAIAAGTAALSLGFGQGKKYNPPPPNKAPNVNSALMPSSQVSLVRTLMNKNLGKRVGGSGKRAGEKNVLVLYDAGGPYGYIGNGYARMLAALLTHFKTSTMILPVEQYQAGMMNANAATFYVGNTYDNVLPAAFLSDAMSTTKPLCWTGYNLWKIAWNANYSASNAAFVNKFGFTFNGLESVKYATVKYNGYDLKPDAWGFGQANVTINSTAKAKVLAKFVSADATKSMPYIVRSNNLWFVGDNPLQDSSTNLSADRSLAFMDVMHDILASGITTASHKAVLRIEDVHANVDPDSLRAIADYLASQNVPYVISVIPHYRDPLGVYNAGDPVDMSINDNPDLVAALKYMVSKGGQVIMHGDTHQYDDVPNSINGVSGDDYEFYRFGPDPNNPTSDIPLGPAFEDSTAWVNWRLNEGLAILAAAGFTPTGWNTPHYFASQVDYQEIAKRFKFSMCRGKIFTADGNGNAYMLDQMVSWPVIDELGMVRLPENLGFVSTARYGFAGQRPKDLVAVAKKMRALRDGWAGAYFHPFLGLQLLKNLVAGLKNAGYTFVMPSEQAVN